MAAFAVILVLSNIASSAKIVDMGASLFGIPLAFDGGTLLFPFAYVLGDVLTEVYGFRAARRAIWTGFSALAFSALLFFALGALPGEAGWEREAGSGAYGAILGGLSSGGIVVASLAGFLAGGFSNSILLSKIKIMMKGRLFWARAMASTLGGQLLDTLVFVSIACAAGVFPWSMFASLALTNYVLKCLVEAAFFPGTYALVRLLKKREGADVYDVGVKYAPW